MASRRFLRQTLPNQLTALQTRTFTSPPVRMVKLVTSVADFKSSIKSGVSVVDFYATWCGPCKVNFPPEAQNAVRWHAVDGLSWHLCFRSLLLRSLNSRNSILMRTTSKSMSMNSLNLLRNMAFVLCRRSWFSRMDRRLMSSLVQIPSCWKGRSGHMFRARVFELSWSMEGLYC